ncbi:hypothetical protein RIF29_21246 [Crotalaria pallida]|uniref:Pectinesterase inhibitor domain-containing protein n=1 Tax=Crotalaria pallida TaxID=3830 RepID=A0AAN9F733_CROPI
MSPSTFPLILFTLCLIFISHAPLPTSADLFKLYQVVCYESSISELINVTKCLKALEVNSRIPLAKSYAELSELIIKLALKNSTGVQDYLKILTKTNPSPAIKQCAVEDYTKIIQDYNSALTLLASSPQRAANILADAQVHSGLCKTALLKEPKSPAYLFRLIDYVLFFCNIAYKSISLISVM